MLKRFRAHITIALALLSWALVILTLWNSLTLLPPCQYEDSSNCYWDAATRGNGEGQSFAHVLIFTIPIP